MRVPSSKNVCGGNEDDHEQRAVRNLRNEVTKQRPRYDVFESDREPISGISLSCLRRDPEVVP